MSFSLSISKKKLKTITKLKFPFNLKELKTYLGLIK